jgi:nicotinamidase-related amidase
MYDEEFPAGQPGASSAANSSKTQRGTRVNKDQYTAPHSERSALILIDVQNDFALRGSIAEIAGTESVLPAMKRVVDAFRIRGRPIVHIVRLYHADGSNAELSRRALLESGRSIVTPGSLGAEVVDLLKPRGDQRLDAPLLLSGQVQALGPQEWAMFKPRWGAFYGTVLEQHLRSLEVDTIVLCGCNFPNCPRTTMYEASERDFRLVFVTDATSQTYDRGLAEISNIGGHLMTTSELESWMTEPR